MLIFACYQRTVSFITIAADVVRAWCRRRGCGAEWDCRQLGQGNQLILELWSPIQLCYRVVLPCTDTGGYETKAPIAD